VADADLTTNESKILKGYESRQVFCGRRVEVFWSPCQGVVTKRRVRRDRLGLRAWKFAFDITGAMAADKREIEAGEETVNVRERCSIAGVLRLATTF